MDRLLFVDDDEKILDSYRKIFESESDDDLLSLASDFLDDSSILKPSKLNYVATYCSQGEEAVKQVEDSFKKNEPIKVVFLDMRMPPGIDGAETARRIHAIDDEIEIVIVSAYSDTDIKDFSIDSGKPEKILFLRKPFDKKEVIQFALNLVSKYDLNKVKDDFLSHVSHELKTPLSSILGFSQLLEDEPSITGEAREFLGLIAENAILMNQLLEDLFTIVASKNNEINLNLEVCDIKQELERIYNLNKARDIGDVNFRLEIKPGELHKVHLDSTRFIQAMNNIINNSFKFTLSGEIVLSLGLEEGNTIVILRDTGVGVHEDKIDTITESFSRSGGYNDVPGLGLGLSIFQIIMDQHGFEYSIDSKVNEGTSIKIVLGSS